MLKQMLIHVKLESLSLSLSHPTLHVGFPSPLRPLQQGCEPPQTPQLLYQEELGSRSRCCRPCCLSRARRRAAREGVGHLPDEDAAFAAHCHNALFVRRDFGHDDRARVARALKVLRALVIVP